MSVQDDLIARIRARAAMLSMPQGKTHVGSNIYDYMLELQDAAIDMANDLEQLRSALMGELVSNTHDAFTIELLSQVSVWQRDIINICLRLEEARSRSNDPF